MIYVHCLPWNPAMHTNVCSAVDMFRSFIAFFRSSEVRMIFLKGCSDEEIRLMAWLTVGDPSFHSELLSSADWQYIAPHHRQEHDPDILVPFIEEVQTKYTLKQGTTNSRS